MSPSWLGYTTAHWEGDTQVAGTAGFNGRTWLDMSRHAHSEALHLTESYRRRDYRHMNVEMTFDDPIMYTRPFTSSSRMRWCRIPTFSKPTATKTRRTAPTSRD
jgi:hypothetical protein